MLKYGNIISSNTINACAEYFKRGTELKKSEREVEIKWFGCMGIYEISENTESFLSGEKGCSFTGRYNPDTIRKMQQWEENGFEGVLAFGKWVTYDESKTLDSTIEIPVQVNGKLRGQIDMPASASREDVEAAARCNENVLRFTEGLTIRKVIVVPGKLVNIVAN